MKHIATHAVAGLLPALAFSATSVGAQEAAPATPPIVTTPIAPVAPPLAPAAAPATSGASAADRAKYEASLAAATGADVPTDEAAPVRTSPRTAAATASRPARRSVSVATVRPTPAPAPATSATPIFPPSTAAPAGTAESVIAATPVVVTPATTRTDVTTTTDRATPSWTWLIGALGLVALVAGAFVALRRRRINAAGWEDASITQNDIAPASLPLAAEPVAPLAAAAPLTMESPDHAEVGEPAAAEVAALTNGVEPVSDRPWIELALRPLRAGTTEAAATVDLELTLANAGAVEARDVRVTTFMLGDAASAPTDIERLLLIGHAGTQVEAGAIGAGEGSRIDASLATPRAGMTGATFRPIVVADVRYALPGGGEGRTAAAFAVGVADDDAELLPLRLGGDMREDVGAVLYGVPERV